jgi:hypothetical protein
MSEEQGAYITTGEPYPEEGYSGVEFSASMPEIQSALKIGGGSARVQFDIPELHLDAALWLGKNAQGRVLKVTVEVEG